MYLIKKFAMSEIGVRGPVAIYFFSVFTTMNAEVMSATILLWIINIGIPALVGSFVLLRLKNENP